MKRDKIKKTVSAIMAVLFLFAVSSCSGKEGEDRKPYGVFLGASPEDIDVMKEYDSVVIDAQYYTEEQIAELHGSCSTVLSYINIGSIEDFRPYYDVFSEFALGDYEHWEEEKWIDIYCRRHVFKYYVSPSLELTA